MNNGHRLMPFLAALGMLALAPQVPAATAPAGVTYTRPTTYTNGSSLPASAITGYKLLCQFTPTGGAATACTMSSNSAGASATSINTTLTYPATGGQACFQVVATANGVDSDPSPVTAASCKALDALVPSAPSNVTVTITLALQLKSDAPITVELGQATVSRN